MDTDTLQQLITMVGNAGEGAFALAMIYIMKGYFSGVVLLAIIGYIVKRGSDLISSLSQDRRLVQSIASTLNVRSSFTGGPLRYRGYSDEQALIMKAVQEVKGD